MDRMSPLDAAFLQIENDAAHMNIASCAIFEGPAPSYEEVVEQFRSRLALAPRCRQKVRFVPFGIGRPVWVDDPLFRLDHHLRHRQLPAPADDRALCTVMSRLMSRPLDRSRPLWEVWMVEGLTSGRWALISKAHHCMVDGISGTDLMAVTLDASPDGSPRVSDDWQPAPQPSGMALVRDAITEAVARPSDIARWLRSAAAAPRTIAAGTADLLRGTLAIGQRLAPNPPLSIEGTIGPRRRWSCARTTMDDVKAVRSALGGTVNDVVLSAVTSGFRSLLLSRDEELDGRVVRSLIPVSVRDTEDHAANNQLTAMIAELPVGISDPRERLHAVQVQMAALKKSHQAEAAGTLLELAGFVPPALLAFGLRAATAVMERMPQRSVNTVTTNVPGPQFPLYACGREMLDYFPFVPIWEGIRTGVAILSYNGKITFGVTGDWDSVPDLAVLTDGIESGMRELLDLRARR